MLRTNFIKTEYPATMMTSRHSVLQGTGTFKNSAYDIPPQTTIMKTHRHRIPKHKQINSTIMKKRPSKKKKRAVFKHSLNKNDITRVMGPNRQLNPKRKPIT